MNKNKLFVSIFTLVFSLTATSTALANPTEADLRFNYRSNGTLAVNVVFDSPTTSRCVARHRSALYFEGDVIGDKGVIRRSTLSRSLRIGRKSTSLRASGLLGVVQKNGADPILSVQVKLICSGSGPVTSNIEARFIRCGSGVRRVSLSRYLSTLTRKLAFSR